MLHSRVPRNAVAGAFAVLALLATAGPSVRAEVLPMKKASMVLIPSKLEVKAPLARVWTAVCSMRGFCMLTGFTPDPASKGHAFARLGDHARAGIWNDKGTLVVTGFTPSKELRVTWEPENASYLCAKRIVLSRTATGTSLEIWDRYTDDQPTVDDTAKKVSEETAKALEAFRGMVEGKK